MTAEPSEALSSFKSFMLQKGLNTTNQRVAIAEAFFEFPGHHSLEEFYSHVHAMDPKIGQTTVYRTLKLLCEAGLAAEIQFGDNITRYEVANPALHHDHLVCLHCGKILEIYNKRVEAIQKEIAASHGFILCGHVHNLYGLCPDCQESGQGCESA